MQGVAFVSQCPFELGDSVRMKGSNGLGKEIYTIDDIQAVHSLKNRTVEFKIIAMGSNGIGTTPLPEGYFKRVLEGE